MVMSVWPRFLAHPVYSFNQVLIFSSHNNIFHFAQSSKEILLLYTVHFNSSFVKNGSNWVVVHIIRNLIFVLCGIIVLLCLNSDEVNNMESTGSS